MDERTVGFSFGQYFGEIDVGFPNLSGIPRVIGEASNLHELSARDTGRTNGGLWWQRRWGAVTIRWAAEPIFDVLEQSES